MTEAEVNALLSSVDETFWTQAGLLAEASERLPPFTRPHLSGGLPTVPLSVHEIQRPSLKSRVNGHRESPLLLLLPLRRVHLSVCLRPLAHSASFYRPQLRISFLQTLKD
jgi:hypothetical protein